MHLLSLLAATTLAAASMVSGPDIDSLFLNPPQEAKPIMIWQWMDGMVTKEGITKDLEDYREAGIGGVQNFQIGGELQGLIADTTKAVGTEKWKELMSFAIDECARLGLSFGTHNCPGWSSSGFPSVRPEDSMQKLVWTETRVRGHWKGELPRPAVEPKYSYYRDIAMMAIPDKEIADTVIMLGNSPIINWRAPDGNWILLRIGHTTNGKTNVSTAPHGGMGLEVDKLSREAIRRYWKTYPSMMLGLAGGHTGKTFTRLEIDSYEAGTQDWTALMPEEFRRINGHDLMKWLPVLTGHKVESEKATEAFLSEWKSTITRLFAEIYYGEMNRLAKEAGLSLLIQPYGDPLDPLLCAEATPGSLLCGEFWTHPSDWGGNSVEIMSGVGQKTGHNELYAEGLTCWPLYPWQDDPASLKVAVDANFVKGVNHLMLHASASNPWVGARPGMSFGKWGTQFQSGQTWWDAGAKPFFRYISRCQALLQAGKYIGKGETTNGLKYIRRTTGEAEVVFVSNPSDGTVKDIMDMPSSYHSAELWFPDSGKMSGVESQDGKTVGLILEGHGSVFVIFRNSGQKPSASRLIAASGEISPLSNQWTVTFSEEGRKPIVKEIEVLSDTLPSWTESKADDVKYFSGTVTYHTEITLSPESMRDGSPLYIDLGKVKNLAVVRVNGIICDTLWKAPFITDISKAAITGKNIVEVDVTNLWHNRMIGDEHEPDDMVWGEEIHYTYAPGSPVIGRFLKEVPSWLSEGRPRPSVGRRTVSCFKFFTKDSPLLESGLIGPVILFQPDVH